MTTPIHFYDVSLVWSEGRRGTLRSAVLDDEILVAYRPNSPAARQASGRRSTCWSPPSTAA
ncbi:hypothetical protein [Flaviaesturariibacter terrae]